MILLWSMGCSIASGMPPASSTPAARWHVAIWRRLSDMACGEAWRFRLTSLRDFADNPGAGLMNSAGRRRSLAVSAGPRRHAAIWRGSRSR
ncbi:hypothetical protein DSL92_05140 [Billgrantia gudaonensis]|uniref:Uncharacterized protein n=1 Tax=Billgrantia gudaonensis TaxID=376427 RepID=A0A3S0NHD6_9GAMM|nr:hypothetical protein DSL92_05140 [Halomonas gudaonensis]